MSSGLTRRQRDMLAFLRKYIGENECSPAYAEMQAAMGLASKSGIHRILVGLEERGHIRRVPNSTRSVVLASDPKLHSDLEQRVSSYCRRHGISRPVFDQRAAESLLRCRA